MNFTFRKHETTGILNDEDLRFFYYDIGVDNLQRLPFLYDWDTVVNEFKNELDVDSCKSQEIDYNFVQNRIRFTVCDKKNIDNDSKSAAFFRHLRNAFAYYSIVREGENFILTDGDNTCSMCGLVNAELLKKFYFRFFDIREEFTRKYENQSIENQ